MKVEIANEKILSNFEVYQHLKEIQIQHNWIKPKDVSDDQKKSFRKIHNHDLEAITKDITSYLSKNNIEEQSVEKITNIMTDLSKFSLEKIEKLQIINTCPHSLVTLYSIVEECDQRFTEEESNEILEIIQKYFPIIDDEFEEEEEEEGEQDEVMADE